MKLDTQKRIAASLLKCGLARVHFNPARLHDIKEGITKSDMRLLISDGLVWAAPEKGVSRVRARGIQQQKRKGLRKGSGSRKGTMNASVGRKTVWVAKVRTQRDFIKELKEKELVTVPTYRNLYLKVKGGYFRSRRHIKLYLDDKRLWQKTAEAAKTE